MLMTCRRLRIVRSLSVDCARLCGRCGQAARWRGGDTSQPGPASTSAPAPANTTAEGHTRKINERKQDEDEDGAGVSWGDVDIWTPCTVPAGTGWRSSWCSSAWWAAALTTSGTGPSGGGRSVQLFNYDINIHWCNWCKEVKILKYLFGEGAFSLLKLPRY